MEFDCDKQDNHVCSIPFKAACADIITSKQAAGYVYVQLKYFSTIFNVPVLEVMKAVETKALEEFGNG